MATDFIMPHVPTTSSRDHYFPPQSQHMSQIPAFQPNYAYAQNYTSSNAYTTTAANFVTPYNPQISPLSTSNNSSPTSPKSQYHTRQVRPLYIPAVLRPNEHPSHELPTKQSGLSNGAGAEGAVDSDDDDDVGNHRVVRSSGSFISLPGLGAFGFGRLTRRATSDSGKCLDSSWNLDLFPEVVGLPSRDHWKADAESAICDEPTCKRHFNYFTRRHHCRRCGNIFCDYHSAYEIPLDENANYNPRGCPSRACAYCFSEFKTWRTRTNSTDLSSNSSTGSTPGSASGGSSSSDNGSSQSVTAPASPVLALTGRPGAPGAPTVAKVPDVAQSVPGDWSWSTF